MLTPKTSYILGYLQFFEELVESWGFEEKIKFMGAASKISCLTHD